MRLKVASSIALMLFFFGRSAPAQERLILPGSPSAAHALRLLTSARFIYKMNSESWSSSNPTLDRFYRFKVRETDYLINRLRRGRSVSLDAVDDALDSEDARRLGGHPLPIPDKQSL
jgi:hypothetical protein